MPRRSRLRPSLEVLEDRRLLTTGLPSPGAEIFPKVWAPVDTLSSAALTPAGHAATLTVTGGATGRGTSGPFQVLAANPDLSLGDPNPVARDDSVTTAAGYPVEVKPLANDTHPAGEPLFVLYTTGPAHGRLFREMDHPNQFLYQPDAGFFGADSFSYSVYDRFGDSAEATVHITVNPPVVYDPPFPGPHFPAPVARDDSTWTPKGHSAAIDVLANDGPGAGALRVASFTQPDHGSVKQVGQLLVFTPQAGFTGRATFTYRAAGPFSDPSNAATVTVWVGQRPLAARPDQAWTHPGASVAVLVLRNDTLPAGAHLSGFQATTAAGGKVTLGPGDALVYKPAAGFRGDDAFTYTIADRDGHTSSAAVTVHVGNRPPVVTTHLAATKAGKPVSIPVLAGDRDPDGDPLSVAGFTQPTHGTVAADPKDPRRLVYTPKAGFTGADSFTCAVSDGHGGLTQETVTVTVT